MLHAIEVAFETQAQRVGCLRAQPDAGADGAGGARRQRRRQLGFTLLPAADRRTDERSGIRVGTADEGGGGDDIGHGPTLCPGCDTHPP